jgi:hypothetical protein
MPNLLMTLLDDITEFDYETNFNRLVVSGLPYRIIFFYPKFVLW